MDGNTKDGHDPVWCFLENVRDPSNYKSGCYSDTTWSAKDGRFWSARACDGLPPIDGGEFTEVNLQKLEISQEPVGILKNVIIPHVAT